MNDLPSSKNSDPNSSHPNRRKRLIGLAKWLIAAAVLVGLLVAGRSAVQQWAHESQKIQKEIAWVDEAAKSASGLELAELQAQRERLDASVPRLENLRWNRIAFAGLLYGLGLIPPSFLLRRALVSLGEHPRLSTTIAAQLMGHVGKYVPGKAMVIVIRAGVLSRDGVRPMRATVSIFLETFLMMAVGAVVAGIVVWWLPVPEWIAITSIVAAIAASLPTFPPILRLVAAKVTKVRVQDVDSQIGWRLFAAGWFWSTLSWLLIGASFTAIVSAIPSVESVPLTFQLYAISTAAIGLAMVIGFASLLPGGAGIRELVLTTVLGVAIGTVHGLLAAIAARIVFIVVEAMLAGLCWCWLRRR
ncbi:MAG: YbhN family protein [Rubripirellula sp.]